MSRPRIRIWSGRSRKFAAFLLDEPTDGQQYGRGRVDVRRDGGDLGQVARLLSDRRKRTDHALGGPLPTFAGRTATGIVRRLHRADRTVVRGRGGRVTMVGRSPGPTATASRSTPAQEQRLERVPEVFQVVRVEERVAGRVEVRQHDAAVEQGQRYGALVAERLYAVDGVQGHPADGEERDDYRQVLRGLHLALPGRTQHAQFSRAVAAPLPAVQQCHLFDLKPKKVIALQLPNKQFCTIRKYDGRPEKITDSGDNRLNILILMRGKEERLIYLGKIEASKLHTYVYMPLQTYLEFCRPSYRAKCTLVKC